MSEQVIFCFCLSQMGSSRNMIACILFVKKGEGEANRNRPITKFKKILSAPKNYKNTYEQRKTICVIYNN
jgi:hypothetical protein